MKEQVLSGGRRRPRPRPRRWPVLLYLVGPVAVVLALIAIVAFLAFVYP